MAQRVVEMLPAIDHGMSAEEILELAERRLHAFAARDMAYRIYNTYYFGEQGGMESGATRAMNSQGRPLMRDLENGEATTATYRSNHLMPIVDDAQALLGRMPNSRVTAPDPSEAGIAKAEKETKYLLSTYELSNMDDQQEDVGFWLPCLGDAMYMLDVDPKLRRVVWQTVDPRVAYPAFKLGHQRFDMLDVILREQVDPYEAKARFGSDIIDPRASNVWVDITIYISQFQRAVVIGNRNRYDMIIDTRWDLPFCPAVWVFNKKNGRFAQSDIAQSLIPQDALDYLGQVFLDGAAFSTYAVPVIREPAATQDQLPPYAAGMPAVAVAEKGDFKFVRPDTDLSAIQLGTTMMTQDIYTGTGTSEVRQEGKLHSSIPTGRAAHALQGPQATRFELKQAKLATAIRRMNAMNLEMQEKGPFLSTHGGSGTHSFEIYGRMRGKSFREEFTPKADIDGWYKTEVRWDLVIGMNAQQRTAMAYEAKAAEIIDSERATEIFGEEDPMGMVERVKRERMEKMREQAQMQAPPGGGGGGAPPGGGPGPAAQEMGGAAGQQQPGNNQAPSPQHIARPYDLGAQQPPLATGVPKGVTLGAVKRVLEPVLAKLKGTVALVGEVAQQGTGQHIDAVISDFKDRPLITPLFRALDQQAKIVTLDESKWPQDAVRIA